jgi:hypothetical protein
MKFYGPVYMNKCKIITTTNYYNSDNKEEEKEKADESDVSDRGEVVDVQPVPASEVAASNPIEQNADDELSFMNCIAEKETADILRKWLHQMMDPIPSKKPKEKLIYLRAVSEADAFIKKLPYKVYVNEFGMINKASYYYWMLRELYYDSNEIDKIVELFRQFLVQFRK